MSKIVSSMLSLLSLTTLSACSSLEEVTVVEETQQDVNDAESIEQSFIQNDELVPDLRTEAPSVKRISAGYDVQMDFEYMYEEVFWGVEENEDLPYQFPFVHPGIVNVGDSIIVDWSAIDPQPSDITLIEANPDDDPVIISEKNVSEGRNIMIEIGEEEIGKQYALQYLWKDGELVAGKTMLNFKVE
ncbi:hypothetical protein [Marinilactibacillus sp. Marseille-P9653]|uniref:hypothetical protein n=1 Tax=Marinilactibacillus sp. Marseille-P9653 TaxID=2866583 RepID=UPI001CE42D79|nr:hypothetical protein [Marinilactibacillus sp. Marseille-P9653]